MEAIASAYACSSSSSSDEEEIADARRNQLRPSSAKWVRNFPHVPGHWPSHVFVRVHLTSKVNELVNKVVQDVKKRMRQGSSGLVQLVLSNDDAAVHLSLSRPFVLTYGEIASFVQEIQDRLKWRKCFKIELGSQYVVLQNDEQTRSFVTIPVLQGKDQTCQIIQIVDQVLRQHGQPVYYENPIPHITIASARGNELYQVISSTREDPIQIKESISLVVAVKSIECQIGNKNFVVSLQ